MTPPPGWRLTRYGWHERGPWRVLDLTEHGPASVPRLEVWRVNEAVRANVATWQEVEAIIEQVGPTK